MTEKMTGEQNALKQQEIEIINIIHRSAFPEKRIMSIIKAARSEGYRQGQEAERERCADIAWNYCDHGWANSSANELRDMILDQAAERQGD